MDRTQSKHPVDKGWAWMICFGTMMVNFYVTGGIRIVGLLFIEIVEYYGADNALASMVMALLSAGFAICSCLGNILGVRFGMRPVAIVGSCFAFAGTALTAAAPNVNVVLITLGLMNGIGYGLMFGPSMVLIGLYFKKYASAASGIAVAGGSLGQLILPHFINYVSQKYAFRGALLMYSALMLHAIPATMLLRPTAFYNPKVRSAGTPDADKSTERKSPLGLEKTSEKKMDVVAEKELEMNGKAAAKSEFNVEKEVMRNGKEAAKLNGEKPIPKRQLSAPSSLLQCPDSPPPEVRMRSNTRFWLQDGALIEKRASMLLSDPGSTPLSLLATSVQDIAEELRKLHQPEAEVDNDDDDESEAPPTPRSALGVFCRKCCDPVLLGNPLFVMFALGISFGHGGYVTTCLFIAPFAYELWSDKFLLAVIISVVGVADLFGRIGGGFVAGLNVIRKPYLVGGSFVISGVCTMLMPFAPTRVVLFVYATVFGMLGGTYMAQVIVQIVELFGPGLLASGLGLTTMFMGLFVIPVPPLLGAAQKSSGSFDVSLRLAGLLLIIGGLFFCFIPLVDRHMQRKRQQCAVKDDASGGDKRDEEAGETAASPLRPQRGIVSLAKGQMDSNENWTKIVDIRESDI